VKAFVLGYGTRGDVQPLLALCCALHRAGHDVGLAAPAPYASLVTGYGIRFTPLNSGMLRRFDTAQMRNAVGNNLRGLSALRALAESSREASQSIRPVLDAACAAAAGADIVIHHPLAFAGQHIAEQLGVPAIVIQIYPVFVPTRAFPNPIYHYRWLRNLPGALNRATYPAFRLMLRLFAGRAVDNWREHSLRLPSRPGRHNPLRWPDGTPAPVLTPVSPHVVPAPPDYPDHVHTTGYWSLPAHPGWTPPRSLTEFLAAGQPPVYVGFGSVVGDAKRAEQVVVQAVQAAGVRAVLATGRGGLDPSHLPPDVLVIDQAPHDWLLPRMAATVHHGGGGTTFAAIAASRPQVVCPFVIDQVFWADRMHDLGVSPAPIPQGRLTVERLAGAIRAATTDAGMARRARQLGSLVGPENGTADAVAIIERILACPRR